MSSVAGYKRGNEVLTVAGKARVTLLFLAFPSNDQTATEATNQQEGGSVTLGTHSLGLSFLLSLEGGLGAGRCLLRRPGREGHRSPLSEHTTLSSHLPSLRLSFQLF